MIRGILALVLFIALLPAVMADSYEISIQPDNTALVTAVIEGRGLHVLELPRDAVPEVKGALYLRKGNNLDISIGSTEKATVSYKTKEFTKGSVLLFSPNNIPVKIVFPNDVEIKSIHPQARISGDMKSIEFKDAEKIEIIYSMPKKNDFSGVISYSAFAVLTFLVLAFGFFLLQQKELKI